MPTNNEEPRTRATVQPHTSKNGTHAVRNAIVHSESDRTRYAEGWRAGKPQEDPSKMKTWGFISARPSEFLIRIRRGEVISSGQGAACFKWPWDSVAIVPTTVQKLHFTAD